MLAFNCFQAITFDCYGTLIDWESGILRVLRPLLAEHGKPVDPEEILEVYAELEPAIQAAKYEPYRAVLAEIMRAVGQRYGFSVSTDEARSLANSLKNWMPFPDTVPALRELKSKYRLGIISNIDDSLFADTAQHLQVAFDWVITAQQAGAYKPSRAIFELALKKIGLPAKRILHVGQSVFHDVIPAKPLGLSTVLVTRRGPGAVKRAVAKPDLEVPDLRTLAQMAVGAGSTSRAV